MSSPEFDFFDPYEDAPWNTPREMLACRGVQLPLPTDLTDERELRGRLWEALYALGGLRFYFDSTDHLSDREFYTWLHEEWLDELTPDVPPEAEFNCRVQMTASGSEEDTELWLRHYASPRDREDWATRFPNDPIPPHEWPPHDRDRFLPEPPVPPHLWHVEDDPDLYKIDDDDLPEDPLGLAAVDREIRGESTPPPPPPGFEEDWQRPLETFSREGFSPLPPEEITDAAMPAYLWELLHELACRGFIVQRSGHLDDRELYSILWRKGIREHAILPGKSRTGAWYYDCAEGDEQVDAWLRYHAGEEARHRHASDYPDEPLPPRETPPYPRDWRLPKGPF